MLKSKVTTKLLTAPKIDFLLADLVFVTNYTFLLRLCLEVKSHLLHPTQDASVAPSAMQIPERAHAQSLSKKRRRGIQMSVCAVVSGRLSMN